MGWVFGVQGGAKVYDLGKGRPSRWVQESSEFRVSGFSRALYKGLGLWIQEGLEFGV